MICHGKGGEKDIRVRSCPPKGSFINKFDVGIEWMLIEISRANSNRCAGTVCNRTGEWDDHMHSYKLTSRCA